MLNEKNIAVTDDTLLAKVIELTRERCTLLTDFYDQASFFFKAPATYDLDAVKPKWNSDKKTFFEAYTYALDNISSWDAATLESSFKELAAEKNIKPGELQLPFRIMLVGGKFGPPVVVIAETIGNEETKHRIKSALPLF